MGTSTQTGFRNIEFALDPNPFTRTGYSFNGWALDWTQASATYADEARVTFDGDRDLYALWKANTYYVSFSKNASDASGSMSNQTFTYDEAKNLTANAYSRTGYTYQGWATSSGGAKEYDDRQSVINLTAAPVGIVPFYAVWKPNNYQVTLKANYQNQEAYPGISGDWTSDRIVTVTYDQYYPTFPVPTAVGYTFKNWYDGTAQTHFRDGPQLTDLLVKITSDRNFWAQWTANTYTVTFDKQGGTGGTDSTTVTYGQAMPTITPPTRTDYIFDGYYDGTNGTGTKYYNADGTGATGRTWNKASNAPLYAQWTQGYVTITFDSNDGSIPQTVRGFDATPMVPNSCFSWPFGGGDQPPSSNYWTMSDAAKNYLIDTYSSNSAWSGVPVGENGVDHLVFTHIPGRKKYTVEMDIEILDHPQIPGESAHTANVNGSAEVVMFFVSQSKEVNNGSSTTTSYIDGSGVVKNGYRRARPYNGSTYTTANQSSFVLMTKDTSPSLADAYGSQQHVTLEIDGTTKTGGQLLQDWLDAWIYIDHSGTFGDSYLKAVCTNCKITYRE